MDELPLRTITDVVDRLHSIGANIITLSGRMQQCPYMGDEPWRELFEKAEFEAERLEEALSTYDRLTKPQASIEIVEPDDHAQAVALGAADFMAFRDARGGV